MGICDRMTLWIVFRPGGLEANGELVVAVCKGLSGFDSVSEQL